MTSNKYTEEELVKLLKEKDKSSFSYLYDNYSAALYGIALKVLNQEEENAQDVLQESFIKIWKSIDGYERTKGTLFTWMLNITRNTAIDKLRSIKRVPIQSIDNNVYEVDKAHQHTLGTDSIGMKEIVSQLKPEHKRIIDLAYYGGYTQDEISQELNMPLGTVKTRARAALSELRKIFN